MSEELQNLYLIARRARDYNDGESAAKYYDMILVKDPNSWEATFYSKFYRASSCTIIQISSAAQSITNCLSFVFSLITTQVPNNEEKIQSYKEIYSKVMTISDLFFDNARTTQLSSNRTLTRLVLAGNIDPNAEFYKNAVADFLDRTKACGNLLSMLAQHMIAQYIITKDNGLLECGLNAYKKSNELVYQMWRSLDSRYQAYYFDNYKSLGKVFDRNIKEYDPNYVNPFDTQSKPNVFATNTNTNTNSGCYVATAVYGSYNCPQVWTLRRFRDYTLAKTWYGRAFIRTYYAISPTLVKWFGETEWFKKLWKGKLDHMVANLNAKGVEDTPYEDKPW